MAGYAEGKARVMTLVDEETKKYLQQWAKLEDRTLSQQVNRLLIRAIAHREKESQQQNV